MVHVEYLRAIAEGNHLNSGASHLTVRLSVSQISYGLLMFKFATSGCRVTGMCNTGESQTLNNRRSVCAKRRRIRTHEATKSRPGGPDVRLRYAVTVQMAAICSGSRLKHELPPSGFSVGTWHRGHETRRMRTKNLHGLTL